MASGEEAMSGSEVAEAELPQEEDEEYSSDAEDERKKRKKRKKEKKKHKKKHKKHRKKRAARGSEEDEEDEEDEELADEDGPPKSKKARRAELAALGEGNPERRARKKVSYAEPTMDEFEEEEELAGEKRKAGGGRGKRKKQRTGEDDENVGEDELDELDREEAEEAEAAAAAPVVQEAVPQGLKIEKLLAYARKSREEWATHCKDMNTSKVKLGRRLELVAFEEAAEEEEFRKQHKDEPEDEVTKKLRKWRSKKRKSSKKKMYKEETRYLVKWAKEAYFHVSWETAKSLHAYIGDVRTVNRHISKLENSFAMMDVEELAELQKIDRVVDYNTFVEEVLESAPDTAVEPSAAVTTEAATAAAAATSEATSEAEAAAPAKTPGEAAPDGAVPAADAAPAAASAANADAAAAAAAAPAPAAAAAAASADAPPAPAAADAGAGAAAAAAPAVDPAAAAPAGSKSDDDEDDEDDDEEEGDPTATAAAGSVAASAEGKTKREVVRWEYLVKWKSQGFEDSTWELYEDIKRIEGCDEAIALFKKRDSDEYRKNRDKEAVMNSKYDSGGLFKNGRQLRSYQQEAVKWLAFNYKMGRGSILADEMGLGKTCQTVTFIHRLRYMMGTGGVFLVIAPLATLPHWQREFEAWTDFNCITYHGSSEGRAMIRDKEWFWNEGKSKGPKGMPRFDALVTNFETVLMDQAFLKKFKWSLLVVDEAHRLKNRDSRLTTCLREVFHFEQTLLLTGTPIQNSLPELWTLLNFIAPKDFPTLDEFMAEFGAMKTAGEMDTFHAKLRPYMLRRIKAEVEPLPDREDTLIEVELTRLQKRFYRAIYEKNTAYLMAGVEKGSRVSLNNVAMELRKCCCHPYLIDDGVEKKVLSDGSPPKDPKEMRRFVFEKMVETSGKLILLDKLLPKLKAEGHRVLIFSQMTRMLDILEDYLQFRQYEYERIDGRVRGVDRQFAIDRFSAKTSQSFAFLLSTRGCGQGINLTAADTVIMYDGDWNPQNDVQALARCHRIGQTKKVKVYRLITRKTYEQTMFQKASMKLGLDKAVMTGITDSAGASSKTKSNKKSKKEQDLETERLLRYGAYAITEEGEDDAEAQEFVNADINEILSKRSKVMNASSEDNQLSKATFVASNHDKNLDVDDPDFWTKVVGLKADVVPDEFLFERSARRRNQSQRVNYANDGFAALNELDKELGPDEQDGEDEGNEEGNDAAGKPKDETEDGRKMWMKKHFYHLAIVIATFGYGRWEQSYRMVESRYPGRFSKQEVEEAIRGYAIFCLLKRKRTKPKPPGEKTEGAEGKAPGSGGESSSEEEEMEEEEEDDNEENSTAAATDGKVISDFLLVNMTCKQAAERCQAAIKRVVKGEGEVYRKMVIPDLLAGKPYCVPDVLVTRTRSRQTEDQDEKELVDFASDDSDFEGEARIANRKAKRGPAYDEELSARAKSTALKTVRMFDKHVQIQSIVEEFTNSKTGQLEPDKFPEVPGSLPADWWLAQDDLMLLAGLHKHGWDPRRSQETFDAIRCDRSLVFSKNPPEEERPRESIGGGTASTAAAPATATGANADTDVKMENGEEEEEEKEAKTPSAAAPAAAPVEVPPAKEDAPVVKEEAPATKKEAKEPDPNARPIDHDVEWPSNLKLGLRAKRVADWFRAEERRVIRKAERRREIEERQERKRADREARLLATQHEWTKTEKKSVYRCLLRYGLPTASSPHLPEQFHLSHQLFLERSGLTRKTPSILDTYLKGFVQDALVMRLDQNMPPPERVADILSSGTSAKKLMERINMMRDLRGKALVYDDVLLRQLFKRQQKEFGSKKKTVMPKWWKEEHDVGLLKGSAKHGVGGAAAHEDIRSDPLLGFESVCFPTDIEAENKKKGRKKGEGGGDDADTKEDEGVRTDGRVPFPQVVEVMNRLRGLVEVMNRHYQQHGLPSSGGGGGKENGGKKATANIKRHFPPKGAATAAST